MPKLSFRIPTTPPPGHATNARKLRAAGGERRIATFTRPIRGRVANLQLPPGQETPGRDIVAASTEAHVAGED
jgi:hypothetical protein